MAFLQRQSSVESTAGELKKFFHQNLFFAFLIALSAIIFCITSESKFEHLNQQQLEFNQFYMELDKLHTELHTYASGMNPSSKASIYNHLQTLQSSMISLENLPISAIYQRDITDVGNMLTHYSSYAESILQSDPSLYHPQKLSWTYQMNQKYYQAQEVYQTISAEFRGLNFQILEYSRITLKQFRLRYLIFICLIVFILFFLMIGEMLYSILLSRNITNPLRELTSTIQAFNLRKLEDCHLVSLSSNHNIEMNMLVHVFNIMLQTIQEQFEKIQENTATAIRLQQKEVENLRIANLLRSSELKALQMQINPHFLFNTLNMISQTAYVEGAETTSHLLDSAATLLRYTLDFSTRAVTLAKELEYLGIYVSLQEQRFGGRIRFLFKLDESFHNIQVPALILQPLVENSIVHGIGMYLKDAVIEIHTEYDAVQNRGIIRIIDNGVGMTEEKRQAVITEMKHSNHPGRTIGLSNVYARLNIFFYNQASIDIQSIPEIKTEITLSLPCILQSDETQQSSQEALHE